MAEVEVPGAGTVTVDETVDCSGMVCPKPQLMAKKALKGLDSGQVAEMLITNPASVGPVKKIWEKEGATFLGEVKDGSTFKLYFKK
jgi:TusA-related sulfurtransferase